MFYDLINSFSTTAVGTFHTECFCTGTHHACALLHHPNDMKEDHKHRNINCNNCVFNESLYSGFRHCRSIDQRGFDPINL